MDNLYWMSWYQKTEDYRPLSYPPNKKILGWWITGYRGVDDVPVLCAMVAAKNENDAKTELQKDWPEDKEWRFIEVKDNCDLNDRFPLHDWMRERFKTHNHEGR